jgi:predicted ATPase
VREAPGEELLETLVSYLEEKQMLLVLDNFEQVIGAARFVAVSLGRCAGLWVIVTSRERLRLSAEQVYEVPALSLPATSDGLNELVGNDAVALFVARTKAVRREFLLGSENAATVAQICRVLEGLPLAIELAAARTSALTPQALLRRLDQRLPLLTGGTRDADERQRTLRATIDWSYDLLEAAEQKLFARLSVFVDGCRIDAAEAVCGHEREMGLEIVDGLGSLVEKSLLRQRDDPDGEPRYWMLETIREYAGERLHEPAESSTVQRRRAEFFADVLGTGGVDADASREWCDRLEPERGNLRAAMSWSLAASQPDLVLKVAIAYGVLCGSRGPMGEAREWLDAALAAAVDVPASLRQRALHAAANLAERQGDVEAGRVQARESLGLAHDIGDARAIGKSLLSLGIIEADAGNLELSETLQREALGVFEKSGNEREERETIGMLAFLLIVDGRNSEARELCRRALSLSRAAGDKRGMAVAASNLGHICAGEGDVRDALQLQRQALLLTKELLDLQWLSGVLLEISALAMSFGEYETAATLLGAIPALAESTQFALLPTEADGFDQMLRRLHQELGEGDIDRASARGGRLSLHDLVACALDFIDAKVPAP